MTVVCITTYENNYLNNIFIYNVCVDLSSTCDKDSACKLVAYIHVAIKTFQCWVIDCIGMRKYGLDEPFDKT